MTVHKSSVQFLISSFVFLVWQLKVHVPRQLQYVSVGTHKAVSTYIRFELIDHLSYD